MSRLKLLVSRISYRVYSEDCYPVSQFAGYPAKKIRSQNSEGRGTMHRAHSKAKMKSKKCRGVLHTPKEEQKIIKQRGHNSLCPYKNKEQEYGIREV